MRCFDCGKKLRSVPSDEYLKGLDDASPLRTAFYRGVMSGQNNTHLFYKNQPKLFQKIKEIIFMYWNNLNNKQSQFIRIKAEELNMKIWAEKYDPSHPLNSNSTKELKYTSDLNSKIGIDYEQ